jgi:hypothetical protein
MECLRKLGFPAPRASAPELCGSRPRTQ